MLSDKKRYGIDLILAAIFGSILYVGIMNDEVRQVASNALLICFSCIGIK